MHLSILSDSYLSDRLGDAGAETSGTRPASGTHFVGLLRGIVFALALLTPFALTFGPAAVKGAVIAFGAR